jgi:alkanesulfonate monooxygenase SsuD/methylene tetrahydromethanopterin reductase-like flavin-dependent oxidoreductase (luciferase family)
LRPPIEDIEGYWNPIEKAQASAMLKYSFVGSPKTVRRELQDFVKTTGVDEVFVVTAMYEHKARLRSYELLAEVGV